MPIYTFRSTVYTCVGALGQDADYETMVKLHKSEELMEEKDRILRSGLGGFLNKVRSDLFIVNVLFCYST